MRKLKINKLNPETLGKIYNVGIIDYKREGHGILMAIGSGFMMAVMDMCPKLRYCTDLSNFRNWDGFQKWLVCMNWLADFIVVAAWYSISKPEKLRESLLLVKKVPLLIYSNFDFKMEPQYPNLASLKEALEKWM